MSLVSAIRIVKFAFQDFWRNIWLSLATVSVLVLTLISVNILLTVNVLGKVAITSVKSKIDVSVYFRPEVEDARVQTIRNELLALPEVKDVTYVSASEAFERFSDRFGSDERVVSTLGEIGENPLGAALVVQARSLDGYPRIMQVLDDPAYASLIEDRDYDDRETMIRRVEAVASRIEWFGLGASAILLLITLLIVYNTIRVSIYTHKEEIAIMRLVGASDSFIRGPFYVGALIWSVLAVVITLALVWPAIAIVQPYLQSFFGVAGVDLTGFYAANIGRIAGGQLLAVAFMSVVTTKLATAKYLRV